MCQPGDQFLHLLAHHHDHIGKFIHHHDDIGQRFQFIRLGIRVEQQLFLVEQGVEYRLPCFAGFPDLAVVARNITHPERCHYLVTTLHFCNTPAQRIGGLFHVGNYRRDQVRDTFVNIQFEHLRIDQYQARFFGSRLEQDAQQHRVNRHRLTRTGGTGNQQMRHFRQVCDHRFTTDVFTQRKRQWRGGTVESLRLDDFAKCNQLTVFVRNFQSHDRLARDDFDHAHADHRERARQILCQVRNLADLDPRCRGDFKPGDNRAGVYRFDLYLDTEIEQFVFQLLRHGFQRRLAITRHSRFRLVQQ